MIPFALPRRASYVHHPRSRFITAAAACPKFGGMDRDSIEREALDRRIERPGNRRAFEVNCRIAWITSVFAFARIIQSIRTEAAQAALPACSHVRDAAPGSPRVHVRERPRRHLRRSESRPRQRSFIPTEPFLSATYHLTCGLTVSLLACSPCPPDDSGMLIPPRLRLAGVK